MKACLLSALLALLPVGCSSLRTPLAGPPEAADALWLPTGHEQCAPITTRNPPVGSLTQLLVADGRRPIPSRRTIANLFPGSEAPVLEYYLGWRAYFQNDVLPILRDANESSPWPMLLAAQLDRGTAEDVSQRTLASLHRALETCSTPLARENLQSLAIVHDIQCLRMLAILSLAQAETPADASEAISLARRLANLRPLLAPDLAPWTQAQQAAERQLGDLAGADWQSLFQDAIPLETLASSEVAALPDPRNVGMDEQWQKRWPSAEAARTCVVWEQAEPSLADAAIIWLRFVALLPNEPDRSLFLNLRGEPGRVRLFVDGTLVGSHDPRDDGRVSCRLSLDALPRGSRPRTFVLRVERAPESIGASPLWHAPWFSAHMR